MQRWVLGKGSGTRALQQAINAAAHAANSPDLVEVGDPTWRESYLEVFRDLTGLEAERAVPMARAALENLYGTTQTSDGTLLRDVTAKDVSAQPTCTVGGQGEPQDPAPRLSHDSATRVMTNAAIAALDKVSAHPQSWPLEGHTVVVLGGAGQLAPTVPLVRAGAHVHAVVRSGSKRLESLVEACRGGAGQLHIVPGEIADVTRTPAQLAGYIRQLPGRLVIASALYAPGRAHLHAVMGADLVQNLVLRDRPDTILAFSGTPTDVYLVEGQIMDAALATQGPNYLGAKRIERWRAAEAGERTTVVAPVLPISNTDSVLVSDLIKDTLAGGPGVGIYPAKPQTAARLSAAFITYAVSFGTGLDQWTGLAAHGGLWPTGRGWSRLVPGARTRVGMAFVNGRMQRDPKSLITAAKEILHS
ncbi:hypothetical protein [Gleimia hominis]|uniref:hypothetical protein n=1 Tax=Gleimia hominis TaxID=595468 RepID=UPI000C80B5ED|nr:hypothetical protein [Gleimia hominis]WIK63864.1 hypothetical protein CJ187_005965 [Gleimia hominis]